MRSHQCGGSHGGVAPAGDAEREVAQGMWSARGGRRSVACRRVAEDVRWQQLAPLERRHTSGDTRAGFELDSSWIRAGFELDSSCTDELHGELHGELDSS